MPVKQTSFDFDTGPEEETSGKATAAFIEPAKVETEPPPISVMEESIIEYGAIKKSVRGRMKLRDMDANASLIEIPEDDVLFEKSYYSIGAVSEMFRVNPSLVRYWENEFDILKPRKNGKGDRFFRPEDVKNLKLIYHLLRERKYTIEGAKDFLKNNKKAGEKFELVESLKRIRTFLNELKTSL